MTEETQVRFIEVPFQVVKLDKDDIIVLSYDKPLTQDMAAMFVQHARKAFGEERKIAFLVNGVEFCVVREEGEE